MMDTVYRAARIKLFFAGRNWGSVKLEISPPEGSAQKPDQVPALPLDFAGLQGPRTLPCLPCATRSPRSSTPSPNASTTARTTANAT